MTKEQNNCFVFKLWSWDKLRNKNVGAKEKGGSIGQVTLLIVLMKSGEWTKSINEFIPLLFRHIKLKPNIFHLWVDIEETLFQMSHGLELLISLPKAVTKKM